MFNVILGILRSGEVHPWTAIIEGCPTDGIAAVDFRRKHGLPEAPTNRVEMPGLAWSDEEFVRMHADQANDSADIIGEHAANQYHYRVSDGKVVQSTLHHLSAWSSNCPYVAVGPIFDYLAVQTAEYGRAVLRDIWDYSVRSKRQAEQQLADEQLAREITEQAKREARLLLADELDAKDRRIATLEGEVNVLSESVNDARAALKPFADLIEDSDECVMDANGLVDVKVSLHDITVAQEIID